MDLWLQSGLNPTTMTEGFIIFSRKHPHESRDNRRGLGTKAHGTGQREPQTSSHMLQKEEREVVFEDTVSESFPD